jgi:hypothetical protein
MLKKFNNPVFITLLFFITVQLFSLFLLYMISMNEKNDNINDTKINVDEAQLADIKIDIEK